MPAVDQAPRRRPLSDLDREAAFSMIQDAYRAGTLRDAREVARELIGESIDHLEVLAAALRAMPGRGS